jgi:hypothetical protein
MSGKQWTKEDFIEIARPKIAAGLADPATFQQQLYLFFAEVTPHYEEATPEGKAYIDNAMNGFIRVLDSALQKASDTAETRKLKRAVSTVQGKHFLAKDLMEVFEDIPAPSDEWMLKAIDVFTRTLQSFMDIMHDVTSATQTGAASLAQVGLFYWLIDELIAAQSLARRNHSTLSYTHLRCTMEILDKVELFGEKPEMAELWMSGDEKAIWEKLSPARIREQLTREAFDPNKKSYDPLYQYLSEQGTHSTFTALKSRFRAKRKPGEGGLGIAFIIGGFSSPSREISILMYCIMLTNLAIMKAFATFRNYLNLEDVHGLVIGVSDDTFKFFSDFLGTIEQSDYDKQPLEILLAAWLQMRDSAPLDSVPSSD